MRKWQLFILLFLYGILLFSPVFLDEGQYLRGARYFVEKGKLYGGTTVVNGKEVPYAEDMPHPPGLVLLLSIFEVLRLPLFIQRLFFLGITITGFFYLIKILEIEDLLSKLFLFSSFIFVFSSSALMTDMPSASFLWISLYFFEKKEYKKFSVFYAFSLFFRYSAIIALPFFLYYGRKEVLKYLFLSFLPLLLFFAYSHLFLHVSPVEISYKWSVRRNLWYSAVRRFGYYSVILIITMPAMVFGIVRKWKTMIISVTFSLLFLILTHQILVSLFVFLFIGILISIPEKKYVLIVCSGILLILFAFPMGSLRYALPFLPFIIGFDRVKRYWYINYLFSLILVFSLLYYNFQIKEIFEEIGMKYRSVYSLFGWGGEYYGKRYGIEIYKENEYDKARFLIYPLKSVVCSLSEDELYSYVPKEWYKVNSFCYVSILPILSSHWGKYPISSYMEKLIVLEKCDNEECLYYYKPVYKSYSSVTNFSEFIFYEGNLYKGIFAHAPDTIVYEKLNLSSLRMGIYIFPSSLSDGVRFIIIVDDTLSYTKTLRKTGVMDTIEIEMRNPYKHSVILITDPLRNTLCDWAVFVPLDCNK